MSAGTLQSSTVNSTSISQQNIRTMCTSSPENDYGTLFNDPQNVHQWAVSSANGLARVTDSVCTGYPNASHDDDSPAYSPGFGPHLSHPSDSHTSTFAVFPADPSTIQAPFMCPFILEELYEPHSTSLTAFETGVRIPSPDFIDAKNSTAEFLNGETWIPGEVACHSSLFPPASAPNTCGDSYQRVASEYNENTPFPVIWPDELPSMEECFSNGLVVGSSESWSPSAVTMDFSISSSQSHGSYTVLYEGRPTSFGTQEDPNQVSHQGYSTSSLDMDIAACFPYSVDLLEGSFDTQRLEIFTSLHASNLTTPHSTIRPLRTCERQYLPGAAFYSEEDSSRYYLNMAQSSDEANIHRNYSGEESKCSARRDQLYKLGPKKDGLYHCPFATNCSHKPDKLKCNYE